MGILIPVVVILFCCVIIWRACDGFEIASEYIGRNMSEGVRGGTINAITSSLPELLTTLIALVMLNDEAGFSIGIGTTAGSALFNGMIIPAACIFAVVGTTLAGIRVTSVNVSTKVLLRDGLTLIGCELVLIMLINGTTLHWWQGFLLMSMYISYLLYMILSMKQRETNVDDTPEVNDVDGNDSAGPIGVFLYWISFGPLLDFEKRFIGEKQKEQIRNECWNGWPILLGSSAVMAFACWLLVIACEWLGSGPGNTENQSYWVFGYQLAGFGMPTMFVAVIFASMATSVPDTVISIRDAKDGDYDDAVANALGSNIFDICFALGFPLFLYTLIHGEIRMSNEVAEQSAELRFLLLTLTIAGFLIYFVGRRTVGADGSKCVGMGRLKACMLMGIYVLFAFYVVSRGQELEWANTVSGSMQQILDLLPSFD